MSPRSVRLTLALALSTLLAVAWRLAPAPRAAQGREDVVVVAHPVAGAVHYLTGSGGNIGVSVGDDGLLIVDDQFADLAGRIRAALDDLDGEGDGAPRYVLNTHFHGDHTGGNPYFGALAPILAHDNVRRRLEDGARPLDLVGLPVITYAEGLSVHFNGEEIRVRHFPAAHTDGDSVVWFTGSKVVHMGDLLFNGMFPYVDIDSGGSVAGLTRAAEQVLEWVDGEVTIVPGHGELADRAALERFHAMLVDSQALVAEALEAGDDVDAMVRNGLLQDYESWSWSFIDTARWLDTLVREARGR
jgi:glyoxylase-like metal-dependent hydrolase (beta-lactamase superfamily II)